MRSQYVLSRLLTYQTREQWIELKLFKQNNKINNNNSNSNQNKMQVDINEPKSKSFNIFLRMFQLAGQLILGYWASKFGGYQGCDYNIHNIVSYIAYAMAALNFISLLYVRCANRFPRAYFFVMFAIDLLMTIAIIVLQFVFRPSNCVSNNLFNQFSIIQSFIGIIICFVILIMRLAWQQRYTNSPGNIVWAPLFLAKMWSENFRVYMLVIGIATAAISVITLLSNCVTFMRTSTSTRRLVMGAWGFGVLVLVILQILAIVKYLTVSYTNQYNDVQAHKTLGIFIAVNAWDILFWLWGFKSFDYQRGDHVREDLFQGKQDYSQLRNTNRTLQKSNVGASNIGTIVH